MPKSLLFSDSSSKFSKNLPSRRPFNGWAGQSPRTFIRVLILPLRRWKFAVMKSGSGSSPRKDNSSRQVMFDVQQIRKDFPILDRKIDGNRLVYLDNAATSQKPESVIQALADYYRNNNANVHRG